MMSEILLDIYEWIHPNPIFCNKAISLHRSTDVKYIYNIIDNVWTRPNQLFSSVGNHNWKKIQSGVKFTEIINKYPEIGML